MADMTPLNDVLNDTPADASPVQANFQIIENYINGADLVRTDGTEVMTADLDMDGNKIVNLADGVGDDDAVNKGQMDAAIAAAVVDSAWPSWTPAVTQSGSVTVTNTRSKYARHGRNITASFTLVVTGSGTGGSRVTISLPATAAAAGNLPAGVATLTDASTGVIYPALCVLATTATIELWGTSESSTGVALGASTFTFGLANGDTLIGTFTYEAAS